MDSIALRGFSQLTFWAADVAAARDWYRRVLGVDAYFNRDDGQGPAYCEFRIGDRLSELGIVRSDYAPAGPGTGGAVMHWHVDDVAATYRRLLDLGATTYLPPIDREAGFVTAAVRDPFGNILGIMYSPHYLETAAV